jgi:hypothetical protein
VKVDLSTGIGAVAKLVDDGISRIWPDKTVEQQDQVELLKAQISAALQVQLAQAAANTAEAVRSSFNFRDGAGWVCVAAFALAALRAPIEWVCAIAGHPMTLPAFDTSTASDMLVGLLGLGGMHMYQSTKGK